MYQPLQTNTQCANVTVSTLFDSYGTFACAGVGRYITVQLLRDAYAPSTPLLSLCQVAGASCAHSSHHLATRARATVAACAARVAARAGGRAPSRRPGRRRAAARPSSPQEEH